MNGICPYCKAVLNTVKLEHVDVQVVGGKSFHGVNYVCPACRVVLSVAIDPVALKSDLIAAIAKELGRQ